MDHFRFRGLGLGLSNRLYSYIIARGRFQVIVSFTLCGYFLVLIDSCFVFYLARKELAVAKTEGRRRLNVVLETLLLQKGR